MMSQDNIASSKFMKAHDQSTLIPSVMGLEESGNCSREGIPFIKNFDEMPLQGVKNRRKLFALDDDRTELQKINCKNAEIDVISEKNESRVFKDTSKKTLTNSVVTENDGIQSKSKKASLKTIQSIRNEEENSPIKTRNSQNQRISKTERSQANSLHSKGDEESYKQNELGQENHNLISINTKSLHQDYEQENNITFEDSDEEEVDDEVTSNLSEDQKKQIQQIEKLLEMQQNIKRREKKSKYAKDLQTNNNTEIFSQKRANSNTELHKTSTVQIKEGSNKQWRDIIILSRVKKFIFKIKQYQLFSQFSNVSGVQLKCIGDQSYDIQSYLRNKKQIQQQQNSGNVNKIIGLGICCIHKVVNLLPSFTVITPNTSFALIWNVLLFLTITMQNLCIPLRMSFGLDYLHRINFYILFLIPCILMNLDLALNFFTAFYDQGVLVTSKKKIRKNYLQMQFWIDFVTNLSFLLIPQNQSFFIGDWIFMIKILQIPEYLSKIDEHFQLEQRFNTVFQLGKLFLLNFFMAHYICCGFHYIGVIEIEGGQTGTWLDAIGLSQSNNYYSRYVNSLYFSFITMITVGYGDIAPRTDNEKIYVTVVTVLSCGLFGYSINTIGSIFQEKSRREQNFRSIKFSITNYMRKRNISRNLQLLVVKNLEYKNQIESSGDMNGQQILNTLNEQLKNDVKEEYFYKILNESKIFRLNFSRKSLQSLALRMKEQLISPGEVIYKSNVLNRNIYFLLNGCIELYLENKNGKQPHILSTFKNSQNSVLFNQLSFFCSTLTSSNARAMKTATNLCFVSFDDFLEVLKEFPLDYLFYEKEAFCKVRDNFSIYTRLNEIQCTSCNNFGHLANECPKYFPISFKSSQVIQKYEVSEPNPRKVQVRFRNFKVNSIQLSQSFRLRLIKFRLDVYQTLSQQVHTYEQQVSRQSQNDRRFVRQMPKFGYDTVNEQYIELPSSDGERMDDEEYDEEDEDEFDDEDVEIEDYQKSQMSKMSKMSEMNKEAPSQVENEPKSSFRRLAADEDSRLQAEYHKDIYTKNDRYSPSPYEGKIDSQNDNPNSNQDSWMMEKKTGTINAINFESDAEVKSHANTPTAHRRELESRLNSNYTARTRTLKHKDTMDDNTKKRFSNLIYEENRRVSEENEQDENDDDNNNLEKDQKSEKYFSNLLGQCQVNRSNSVSSSKKQIQTSSAKQQNRSTSKSDVNSLYNDRGENYHNTRSIISLSKQNTSNINASHKEVGRGSNIGIKKIFSQNISSNIKNSSKNLSSNMKQGTLDYLNSIHYSINQTDYEKTFVSHSSIDPVQYKGSQNFSTTCIVRGRSQTGGPASSMQEVNKNRSTQVFHPNSDKMKPSFRRLGTTAVNQQNQKDQKSLRDNISLYDEGFTSVKEYEIYFPINNQKTVMKKLKLYQLKNIIKMKKEQPKRKRVKSKRKMKNHLDSSQKPNNALKLHKINATTLIGGQPSNKRDYSLSIDTNKGKQNQRKQVD